MIKGFRRKLRILARQQQEPLLRSWFRFAGRISPRLSAKMAQRLFLTPARFARTAREKQILAKAHAFSLKIGDTQVQAWRWGEGPQILLVHGWSGRGGQWRSFIDPLVKAGFSVLTFDAPAHGDSEGTRASLFDFTQTIERLSDEFGPFHGIVAHSFGGPAAMYALERGVKTSHLVLVASPLNIEKTMHLFARKVGLPPEAYHEMKSQIEARYQTQIENFNYLKKASQLTTPLLMVHDLDDKEVNWASSEKMSYLLPNAQLLTTKGKGHYRILKDVKAIGKITQFLKYSALNEPQSPSLDVLID